MNAIELKRPSQNPDRPIQFELEYDQSRSYAVRGDIHLLRRMIRNALENAASFARTKINITLSEEGLKNWTLTIDDDGPGFSHEILKSFGERRVSRVLQHVDSQNARLSVGLGSVILKTVAQVHGGKVKAENRGTQSVLGARVLIWLPRHS